MTRSMAIVLLILVIGLSLKFLPLIFILVTIVTTVVIFSQFEYEISLHKRQLYTERPPTKNTLRRTRVASVLSGIWIGLLAGLLPAIMVGGAKSGGDWISVGHFVVVVLITTVILVYLREQRGVRPLQFGLVRMALPAGLLFALIGMTRKPMPNKEAFEKTLKVLQANLGKDASFSKALEVLNSLFSLIDNVVGRVCHTLFGDALGRIIHLLLTIDLAYGISITVFALALVAVWGRGPCINDRPTSPLDGSATSMHKIQ